MPIVNPKVKVVRVDLDGAGGGSGAAFTLNASTGSVSLVAGTNISLSSNLSTITIIGGGGSGAAFTLNGSTGSVSLVTVTGGGISLAQNLSTITISNRSAYSNITGAMSGNTLGTDSTSIEIRNNFILSGGGIVSVGASGANGSITISATTPSVTNYSTITATMAGNTLGAASTTLTVGNSLSISGAGAVSVGASAGTITISAPIAAGSATQSFSGGGTSITGAAISVAIVGGNNISLASASAAGSLTLTVHASSNALANVSLLNGSSGAMSVSAGAGIGIGQANSTITISASVQTSNVTLSAAGNTLSTASVTGTFSNSLVISGAGILSGAVSTSGNTIILSASTPSVTNFSTISLSASGNTIGASSGTMNNVLALSGAGIVSVGAGAGGSFTVSATTPSVTNFSTITISAAGNTLSTASVTGTFNNSLVISGAGILSGAVSTSGNTVILSASTPSVVSAFGTGAATSTGTIVLAAGANITLNTGAGSITIVGAAAGAGTQSLSAGANSVTGTAVSLALAAGAGISLATATGAGSLTATISNSAPNAAKLLMTRNIRLDEVNSAITKAGTITGTAGFGSSLFLQKMYVPAPITVTEFDEIMAFAFPATSQGTGTLSRSLGIYSFGNNTSLASVTTASLAQAWGSGTSTAGASSSLTQFQGGWTSPCIQPMTFGSFALTPGEYVIGRLHDVAQGSSTWTISLYGWFLPAMAAASGITGSTTASVASVTATPQVTVIAGITQAASNNISWFVSRATSAVTSVASATSSFTFLESPFVASISTSAIQGVTGASPIQVHQLAFTGGSIVTAGISLPNFGYIGTGSTTSGLPTIFDVGIMSTGALPTAITVTSTAVTYSGSAALQQPYFALVGS